MEAAEFESRLHNEGFSRTYAWRDEPETFYPDHRHDKLTAHIILDGQMTLTIGGKAQTYYPGDRCDVSAGVLHSALIGPQGCQYLVGEKCYPHCSNGNCRSRGSSHRRNVRLLIPVFGGVP
jgi:hypothetical protein